MALQKLELRPGVNRESTNYANEGGFFISDKVRFRGGFAQKIGGWQNITSFSNTFKGVCRYMWNYISSLSQNLLSVATNQKLYVEFGGDYNDITPLRTTATLGVNPISTTSGSKYVVITHVGHGATLNTYISISGATAVGGITLSGEYEIISVITADSYAVIASSNASSTATGGGSAVVVAYQINAGPGVATLGIGWGGPPWGAGGWGSGTPVGLPMRLWSIVNYENDLIFADRDVGLYYWTLDTSTWARGVSFQSKTNSVPKATTTANFSSGATTITVADATFITTGAVLSGTGIPAGTYVTTAWTGGTSVPISAATTASGTGAVITIYYAGRHAPDETSFVNSSPVNDFLICFGSKPYNPVDFQPAYDPLLIRWSDQGNPFEWVPSLINQSGERRVTNGSVMMASVSTRQEILFMTDTAVYSMQYVGPPFVWSINLIDQDISVASQNAVIAVNNSVYWMGIDKFFIYNGRVQVLPCTLRQHVFSTLNRSQISQVMCGINESFSEVWWFYPGTGSSVNSMYVVYNYQDNVWHYGNMSRTAYVQQTLRQFPMLASSVQGSYLSANIGTSDTSVVIFNASTFPSAGTILVDSEQISYTGISGNYLTGCVRGVNGTTAASHSEYASVSMATPNQVMFHEVGWDDLSSGSAQPITAFIQTSDIDIADGDTFTFVSRIIPDVKFLGSTVSNPSVTMSLYPHNYPGSAYGTPDTDPVQASAVLPVEQYTEQLYTRIRGRQLALRVSSSDLGVAWQLGAVRFDMRPDGRR